MRALARHLCKKASFATGSDNIFFDGSFWGSSLRFSLLEGGRRAIIVGMTDEELLDLNERGFFPGPDESEEDFLRRVEWVKQAAGALGERAIPSSHWVWARLHLRELFGFAPECLPAYYSNRSLAPWQGAASWIEGGKISAVQLRENLKRGSYLGIYRREEILGHEAVHAARSAFEADRWEEFFAYMTSESRWRRVLGPIVRSPWEVWPFLAFCLIGSWLPAMFLGAAAWAGIGFWRLARGHWILRRASEEIKRDARNVSHVRAILVRLADWEIERLAKGLEIGNESLRWRLLRLAYWKKGGYGTENNR